MKTPNTTQCPPNTDLLTLIEQDGIRLTRTASTNGGEYHGACPKCGGKDRLVVHPNPSRGKAYYWCRKECGVKGDTIQYLRDFRSISFPEAQSLVGESSAASSYYSPGRSIDPKHLPPNEDWDYHASVLSMHSQLNLLNSDYALEYLESRGITKVTAMQANLGYNPQPIKEQAWGWGFEDEDADSEVYIPDGLVIPWSIGGRHWRVSIRSLNTSTPKEHRYKQVRGASNGLYGADLLRLSVPVLLVEGELDALSINQTLHTYSKVGKPLACAVATGSISGSRTDRWVAQLSQSSKILVAFDADDGGDSASEWWLDVLDNAQRCRPWWGDANQMLRDGVLKEWLDAALN